MSPGPTLTLIGHAKGRHLDHLISLLANPVPAHMGICESAACILANCCDAPEQQQLIADMGAIPCLMGMLCSNYPKVQS